jgi:hypothetical protein
VEVGRLMRRAARRDREFRESGERRTSGEARDATSLRVCQTAQSRLERAARLSLVARVPESGARPTPARGDRIAYGPPTTYSSHRAARVRYVDPSSLRTYTVQSNREFRVRERRISFRTMNVCTVRVQNQIRPAVLFEVSTVGPCKLRHPRARSHLDTATERDPAD